MPPRMPKTRLDEERRFDQSPVEEVTQVVEMGDVVALELETGAVFPAGCQNVFDILERILEHQVAGGLQVLPLPVELEGIVAIKHGKQAEIH